VPSGRKVNGKALSSDIALTAGDVGAYSKGETDQQVNDAKSVANTAQTAANNANNNANGRVPSGRKINGKPLSGDIALTATDVGAYNRAETYNKDEVNRLTNEAKNSPNSMKEMRLSSCRFHSFDSSILPRFIRRYWETRREKQPYSDSGRLKGEILLNIYFHLNNDDQKWTQKQFATIQYFLNGQWVNIADDDYKITDLDTLKESADRW
ncbi:hypothetical protein ID859_09700, partial [Xenorhabdus sp. 38]|nr:hypothetical protein [Xenorhabdus sp. 38]